MVRTPTGGSPSVLFLFSAKRKEKISLTRITEEPLDCGNDNVFSTFTLRCVRIVSVLASPKNIIFGAGWGSGGVC